MDRVVLVIVACLVMVWVVAYALKALNGHGTNLYLKYLKARALLMEHSNGMDEVPIGVGWNIIIQLI